jgi:tetrahydromethanopterin S-methyltransferase subunit G
MDQSILKEIKVRFFDIEQRIKQLERILSEMDLIYPQKLNPSLNDINVMNEIDKINERFDNLNTQLRQAFKPLVWKDITLEDKGEREPPKV